MIKIKMEQENLNIQIKTYYSCFRMIVNDGNKDDFCKLLMKNMRNVEIPLLYADPRWGKIDTCAICAQRNSCGSIFQINEQCHQPKLFVKYNSIMQSFANQHLTALRQAGVSSWAVSGTALSQIIFERCPGQCWFTMAALNHNNFSFYFW